VLWNKIAILTQDDKWGMCWFDIFLFHPCRVAGSKRQVGAFFQFSMEWL
jgi:hypothetical protein